MAGGALIALGGALSIIWFLSRAPATQVAWARLDTEDVHSLAFANDDSNHLLFGHHSGVLDSIDGGRTWLPLNASQDAMSLVPATDGSIVIAGHDVFAASHDGGKSWQPIESDLPSLDVHGFTRDPGDPARMWAYLATGGLWQSSDFGAHWKEVRQESVAFPVAIRQSSTTTLLGVDVSGFVTSSDEGRSWSSRGTPPTYPMTSLTATTDGSTIYAGSPDGLFQSTDGGSNWRQLPYRGSAFAVATTAGGNVVAVVSRQSEFFRSDDGGNSWRGP